MNNKPLKSYQKKRNFDKTCEPETSQQQKSDKPIFVIQKHDASQLHYDFRLQYDDVLWSWAVPKGLSTGANEKRLAIRTDDHPLDYADFEGVIPEDEYGGGTVLIWDRGSYHWIQDKEENDLVQGLEQGSFKIHLNGQKIKGGYALTRVDFDDSDKEQWLIFKLDDDYADARRNPVSTEPNSVVSGRTLEQIKEDYQD